MRKLRKLWLLGLALSTACANDGLRSFEDTPNRPATDSPFDNDDLPDGFVPDGPGPEDLPTPDSCQTGALTGRLCLPDSNQALAQAAIYLYAQDCVGETALYGTTTRQNGQFSLVDLPEGEHQLVVEHADYQAAFDVRVRGGEIEVLDPGGTDPICLFSGLPRVAIISGEFDPVARVLDRIEVDYDIISNNVFSGSGVHSEAYDLLMDLSAMREYDVLLFSCGVMGADFLFADIQESLQAPLETDMRFDYSARVYQNIRDFVSHGGNIYASDWAWPIVEGISPDLIDFFGDESNGRRVLVGSESNVQAEVLDEGLELFMASGSIPVDYDLQGWAVVEDVAPDVHVFLRSDVPIVPLVDQGGSVKLGSPEILRERPVLVGMRPFAAGGVVLYTTFHYNAQPTQQMKDVLTYLVFQL